jgi:N-acetyl-anhydromuramyl-L-alanine amidase AmpD
MDGRVAFGLMACVLMALGVALASCHTNAFKSDVVQREARKGDEIMVGGMRFHTGAPVVLWSDSGGYNGYRTDRYVPTKAEGGQPSATGIIGPRYGPRLGVMTEAQFDRVHPGGHWTLSDLQQVVDQFVIHYDVAGTSRQCFHTLQDLRGLSVHFMIDLDGTIYQTLDAKERAWHATISNDRSVGVEMANIGAYGKDDKAPFDRWYGRDAVGPFIHIPPEQGRGGIRTPGFVGRPIQREIVVGTIQGRELRMYDFTAQQYDSLIKLTAALCTAFPRIRCDYPRDSAGHLVTSKLSDADWARYSGLLGHYHIQENKADPGPAMQWDLVVEGARNAMGMRLTAPQ